MAEVRKIRVYKEGLPMMKGESIEQYTSELRGAGRAHMALKLNLGDDDYSWVVEAYKASAIFEVSQMKDGVREYNYYGCAYSRNKTSGQFTFGDVMKVRKVVSYEPIS